MKIALFGGSFDPIHEGHLEIAKKACDYASFDRFFFLPAACSPFKRQSLPADGRLRTQMLSAALKNYDCYPFEISNYELEKKSVSYSIDTVKHFKTLFPQAAVTWIGGEDLLAKLPLWKDADRLRREVTFLIFRRSNRLAPSVPDGFQVDFLPIPPIPFSSSSIRSQIKKETAVGNISGLLPAVAEIIEKEGLYR